MSEEAVERRNEGTWERGDSGTGGRRNGHPEPGSDAPSFRRSNGPDPASGVPSFRRSIVPPDPVIIAESPGMRRAVDLARRFAPTTLPVLLVGETGTGKEVLAQAIHRWSGRRGELVDVDCGALPAGMVVNELFGHRRGAYTSAIDSTPGLMERANHGTLFLDELTSLAPEGQAALLRVLETGEMRRVGEQAKVRLLVRLITAVQDELAVYLQQRRLRSDLYQRLAGGIIQLPPLRHRPEDLWPLARRFSQSSGLTLTVESRRILERHPWPGNIRELRHVIARAACLTDSDALDPSVLAEAIDAGTAATGMAATDRQAAEDRASARAELAELGRKHAGDVGAMAAALNVSRSTLYRRLQRVGLRLQEVLRTEHPREAASRAVLHAD